MAIKNIFGFDQFAPRVDYTVNTPIATMQRWFDEEGYPFTFTAAYTSGETARFGIYNYLGRNWFGCNFAESNTNYRLHWIMSNTFGAFYGAESPKTKWYGGFRVYKAMSAINATMALLRVAGYELIQLNSLPNGEHYVEWCIDWPNATLTCWIDGAQYSQFTSVPLTIGHQVEVGRMNGPYWYGGGPLYFTDFYFLTDTQDATPCNRLGPIKVTAIPLDEATLPSDWSTVDGGGVVTINGTPYNNIIPPMVTDGDYGFTFSYSGPSAFHSGTVVQVFDHNNTTRLAWTAAIVPSVGAPALITAKLPQLRKVDAYGIAPFNNTGYSSPTSWFLEGSLDGVVWDRLHTITADLRNPLTANKYYEIPAGLAKEYLYYRLGITDISTGQVTGVYAVADLYLFTKGPFKPLTTLTDQLRGNGTNFLNQGIRTSTNQSEAVVSLSQPAVGDNLVLYVQVRTKALRDAASSDVLSTKLDGGGITRVPLVTPLLSTFKDIVIGEFYKKDDGTAFKAADIGQIGVTLKSIPGA